MLWLLVVVVVFGWWIWLQARKMAGPRLHVISVQTVVLLVSWECWRIQKVGRMVIVWSTFLGFGSNKRTSDTGIIAVAVIGIAELGLFITNFTIDITVVCRICHFHHFRLLGVSISGWRTCEIR